MLIFIIANYFPYPAILMLVNPSGTLPETNFTIGGSAGKIYGKRTGFVRMGKCPYSLKKNTACSQGTCTIGCDSDKIPAAGHLIINISSN
jgi:hypothetical protein